MRKRVSPMNPNVANPAVRLGKTPVAKATNVKCMTLFALLAARPAKCPSSPMMTVRSTAVIASGTKSNLNSKTVTGRPWRLPVISS